MTSSPRNVFLVLSHQLFPLYYLKGHENDLFVMIEDKEANCLHSFHKYKLIFCLSSMRHYARELKHRDFNLIYFEMDETKGLGFEKIIKKVMKESGLNKITMFEIESKDQEATIQNLCEKNGYELKFKTTPGFLSSREDFKKHLEGRQKPNFLDFYEEQRKRNKILMDKNGTPSGGRFTLDDEERLKWTHKTTAPKFPASTHDEIDAAVIQLVEKEFPENPGIAMAFWYPTSRASALQTFKDFCSYRLAEYGSYENAISPNEDFLFHSVLSTLLNAGLLVPNEVIQEAVQFFSENPVPMHSIESYVRHVLGWREYVRGVYQNFGEQQINSNFWKHHRLLNKNWLQAKTGVPPLDDALNKANRLSYNHRAERLFVLCNMMNLAEIHPREVYRWFSQMHMDSADWVTVPNVFGVGLYADGGVTRDKVSICNSNYWLKTTNYEKGPWCDEVDGLYWRFVEKHESFFAKDPEVYTMVKNLEKLTAERREVLWRAADAFLARNTVYP